MADAIDVPARRRPSAGSLALALAVAASVPLLWPGLIALASAWATPEYSHGPLIPVISGFLLLRELRDRAQDGTTPGRGDRVPGLMLGLFALGLALAGGRTGIPDLSAYAVILWTGAILLCAMGWRRGRRHWAPVLHLVFMLPLPQVLYWHATTGLQTLSSELGVALLRGMGVPVLLNGHVIDLGVWKLQVAEACSGLRYLFPILSFSYLIAILYRGPFWHRAVLFALAAPVAVGLNAARIGVIGWLTDRHGIAQAEGALHVFEGWVVFGLCVAVLLLAAAGLGRLRGTAAGPLLDLDASGVAGQSRRLAGIGGAGALAALALAWAGAGLTLTGGVAAPPVPDLTAMSEVPGWTATDVPLDPAVARVLAADAARDVRLTAAGTQAPPVHAFVAWYARQTGGAGGLHAPEVCLPAGGWEIASIDVVRIDARPANRAVITRGLERQMVVWWFEARGRRRAGAWQAKFDALRDALTTGRSDGALVRFTTPIGPGEDGAAAEARLRHAATDVGGVVGAALAAQDAR